SGEGFMSRFSRRLFRRVPKGRSFFAIAAALMVLAVYAAVPALAVHDTGVFELDKNAVQDTPPAEDWQNVCDEANPPSTCLNNSTASAHTFETDMAGQSIFTGAQSGGSSKDPQLISGWRWKSGSVPDKDEILHGYAARYSKAPDTTPPTLCPAGPNPADDGARPGGANGSCSNHVCDDLIPLQVITNADCGVAGAGDAACAVVNTGSTTSPWPFKDKSGNTSFATAEFYEGGINLSL